MGLNGRAFRRLLAAILSLTVAFSACAIAADPNAVTDAYDFENRLVRKGGVTIVYDGDGNRVSKTAAGSTTQYLVDTLNPTGYAQVVDEIQKGALSRTYSWGLELIDQARPQPSAAPAIVNYYVFDGHGSVRALTNSAGAITDTYDYNAFGNLIHSSGSTPNVYLYAGEQFDPDLNLYYNRARYLNAIAGRFWSMDTDAGGLFEPLSLHRYLYANSDPVNTADPSGRDSIAEFSASFAVQATLATIATVALTTVLRNVNSEVGIRLNHYAQWIFLPLNHGGRNRQPKGDKLLHAGFLSFGC